MPRAQASDSAAPTTGATPTTPSRAAAAASRAARGLAALLGGAATLVTLASLIAWLTPTAFGDRPATCLTTSIARCFCEAVGTGLLRQPANALSSLAFCVAALVAADRGRRLARHTPERALAPVVALTLLALGAGSLAYHAQLTFAGQVLDVQGMYLLGTLLITGALWRRGTLTAARATLLAVALIVGLLAAQAAFPDARRWLFALVLLPGIALEWRLAPRSRPLALAVVALVIAYAVWLADDRGLWCEPTSWLQGHAVWHLLTALAGGLLVPHYEQSVSPRMRQLDPSIDPPSSGPALSQDMRTPPASLPGA